MSNEQIEGLRAIIANTSLTEKERSNAAAHAVQLQLSAVEAQGVADDDDEVAELMSPKDGLFGTCWPFYVERITGRRADRFTLHEAKKIVLRRKLLRVLLTIVVDESNEELERLAACQEVFDTHLDPRHAFKINAHNAPRLLAAVLPATALKWMDKGKVPVERPPKTLADVW
ncbi:MAG: hypothetical protein JSS95_06970 [Acidobacteria bacterium]|nr:hypothetical protein [Acidobacteriota bacterium]